MVPCTIIRQKAFVRCVGASARVRIFIDDCVPLLVIKSAKMKTLTTGEGTEDQRCECREKANMHYHSLDGQAVVALRFSILPEV